MPRKSSEVTLEIGDELLSELLDVNSKLEEEMKKLKLRIKEAKDLNLQLKEKNEKTLVSGKHSVDLDSLKKLNRFNSITRSRVARIKIEEVSKIENVKSKYEKYKDRLYLLVDGGNADSRRGTINGYLVTLIDFMMKGKQLIKIIDIILDDMSAIESSIEIQLRILKYEFGISEDNY